jgi:hypothetical protein
MNWRSIAAGLALCSAAAGAGAVGNTADVTIYDRAENRSLPVYRHQGRYYVVGRPGNEYLVRVRNRTGDDILAVVSVDGINAVTGETADWSQTGYVLGRHQGYSILGWRKSEQRTAAFYFTEHRNSYAARTGRPDNVGVIGVALFRNKGEPEARINPYSSRRDLPASGPREDTAPAAADEALSGHGSARSAESAAGSRHAPMQQAPQKAPTLGTGHGRSEASYVTYTDFERATEYPAEVITIHYNTHANLVAMGVIRAPRIAQPTPFPGQFVPDPR